MIFKEEHVVDYGFRCVTFRSEEVKDTKNEKEDLLGRQFIIKEQTFFQCQPFYQSKQSRYKLSEQGYPVKVVFPLIRLLYDHNGILIARRINPTQPLKFTGKGITKQLVIPESKTVRGVS